MNNDDKENPLDKIPKLDDDELLDIPNKLDSKIKAIELEQKIIIKTIKTKSTMMIITIVVIMIVLIAMIANNSRQIGDNSLKISDEEFESQKLSSGYVIENLKGEKINTWVSWKVQPDDLFHIHVIDGLNMSQKQLDIVNDVIFSTEMINRNEETYYKGWRSALESSASLTKYPIPIHYHSVITDMGTGHITIKLTTQNSGDGYSGYTKSQVDEENHQILKSQITIYSVDQLSTERFKAILRHELGHAFGLAHSEYEYDLMYPEIKTIFPYISSCDIQGIIGLYNGEQKSKITCA